MFRYQCEAGHRSLIVEAARDDADARRQFRAYWPHLKIKADEIKVHRIGVAAGHKPVPDGEPDEYETAPSEPTDPTLAELGIDGENAELLTGEGLTTLSAIKEYARANKGLQAIHDVGPKREAEILEIIRVYLGSLGRSDPAE